MGPIWAAQFILSRVPWWPHVGKPLKEILTYALTPSTQGAYNLTQNWELNLYPDHLGGRLTVGAVDSLAYQIALLIFQDNLPIHVLAFLSAPLNTHNSPYGLCSI